MSRRSLTAGLFAVLAAAASGWAQEATVSTKHGLWVYTRPAGEQSTEWELLCKKPQAVPIPKGKDLALCTVEGDDFTDADLADLAREFAGVASLKGLFLLDAGITDAGLAQLSEFPSVTELSLNEGQLTDGALVHVGKLTGLVALNIGNASVTDAGLRHVARLRNLETVFLRDTEVLEAGRAALKVALPACRAYH